MNKIFKVVWSKSKQCYVVVSEIAKNTTGKKKIVVASIFAILSLQTSHVMAEAAPVPSGGDQPTIVIGKGTQSTGDITNGISMAPGAQVFTKQSIAIGYRSRSKGVVYTPQDIQPAIALGAGADANGAGAVAIGLIPEAHGNNAISIGSNTKANATGAIGLGKDVTAIGSDSVSLGTSANASGSNSVSLGISANATDSGSIAIGKISESTDTNSVALGYKSKAKGASATAIGPQSEATKTSAVALGRGATATEEHAVAIGDSASAAITDGVALGYKSKASIASGVAGYDANANRTNKYAGLTGNTLTSTLGAVSIGDGTNNTRQITGLAAGTNDTDAVNVAQLKSVNLAFTGDNSSSGDVNLVNNKLAITGDNTYITTAAANQGLTIKAKKETITVSNGTASASIGVADARNVADAINQANADQKISYKANSGTAKSVKLSEGLHFTNGTSTVATVGNNGEVTYDLNGATNKSISDSEAAVKRTISLGADSGARSSQSLNNNNVAFDVKGDAGSYITTAMVGDTLTVNTTRGTIQSDTAGTASLSGSDGLATAQNVATAINKAKEGAAWDLAVNSGAAQKVSGGNKVTFKNGKNISLTQSGTTITVGTTDQLTADNVTVGTGANQIVLNGTTGEVSGKSIKAGSSTLNTNGLTISNGPSVTSTGINAGNKVISGVSQGVAGTDAVNKNQMDAAIKTVADSTSELGRNTITLAAQSGSTTGQALNSATGIKFYINGESGSDALISTTASGTNVSVASTQKLKDAVTQAANAANKDLSNLSTAGDTHIKDLAKTAATWNVSTNGSNNTAVAGGETVNFINGDNVAITNTGRNITIGTAKNVSFDKVTLGGITIDKTNGINAGGKEIKGIADGTAADSAVNKGQMDAAIANAQTAASSTEKVVAKTLTGDNNLATVTGQTGTAKNETYEVAVSENAVKAVATNAAQDAVKVAGTGLATVSDVTAAGVKTYTVNVEEGKLVLDDTTGNIGAAGSTQGSTAGKDGVATTQNVAKAINDAVTKANANNAQALADAEHKFDGDTGTTSVRKHGEVLSIKGGVTTPADLTTGNIGVVSDGAGTLNVRLAKVLTGLTSATYTDGAGNTQTVTGTSSTITDGAGKTTSMTKDGLSTTDGKNTTTVAPNGVTATDGTHTVKLEGTGIDAGNTELKNIAAGTAATSAVNKQQMEDAVKAGGTWKVTTNTGATTEVTGGDTVDFINGDNITITNTGRNITIGTAKNVSFDKVTVGGVTIDKTDGINAGGTEIKGIADGTAADSAVSKSQMETAIANAQTAATSTEKVVAKTLTGDNNLATVTGQTGTAKNETYEVAVSENAVKAVATNAAQDAVKVAGTGLATVSDVTAAGVKTYTVNVDEGKLVLDDATGTIGAAGSTQGTTAGKDGVATTQNVAKAINDAVTKANANNAQALADAEHKFDGDTGTTSVRKHGEVLSIKGGVTTPADLTTGNIGVVSDGAGTLNVKLAKVLSGLTSATYTDGAGNTQTVTGASSTITDGAGKTTSMTKGGLSTTDGTKTTTVAPSGVTATDGTNTVKVEGSGIDAGNTEIKNVAAGTTNTSAVNKKQMDDAISKATGDATHEFGGDDTVVVSRKHGEKLNIKGGASTTAADLTDGNIAVLGDATTGTLNLKLAKALTGLTSATYTDAAGNTTTVTGGTTTIADATGNTQTLAPTKSEIKDNAGVSTVTTKDGVTAKDGSGNTTALTKGGVSATDGNGHTTDLTKGGLSTTDGTNTTTVAPNGLTATDGTHTVKVEGTGIDAGNTEIKNVAAGTTATSAVNKGQMDDAISKATADATHEFAGDTGNNSVRKHGEVLSIKGGVTDTNKLSDNNIGVVSDGAGTLNVKLAKDLKDLTSATYKDTAGNTTTVTGGTTTIADASGNTQTLSPTKSEIKDNAGVSTVTTKDGVTAKDGSGNTTSLTKGGLSTTDGTNTTTVTPNGLTATDGTKTVKVNGSGIDAGNTEIKNVADGTTPHSAINKNQLDTAVNQLQNATDNISLNIAGDNGTGNVKLKDQALHINGTNGITTKANGQSVTVGIDDSTMNTINNTAALANNAAKKDLSNVDQAGKSVIKDTAAWNVKVNSATSEIVKGGDTVTFNDGHNITITNNGKDITVATKKEVTFDKVSVGGITIDKQADHISGVSSITGNGSGAPTMTFNAPNGSSPANVSMNSNLDMGGKQINNVGLATHPTDAVNKQQVDQAMKSLAGMADNAAKQYASKAGANAAALAALKPIQYDPLAPTQIMAGIGNYKSQTAVALGVAHYSNEDTMFNIGASLDSHDAMLNAGVTHKFGSSAERKAIPERYKGGPISSIYVMQDEVSTLKEQNSQMQALLDKQSSENAAIVAENKMLREQNEEMQRKVDLILSKLQ